VTPRNRRVAPADATADGGPSRPASDDTGARRHDRTALVAGVRAILGAALVLGLSTSVAWAARRHVLSSPRFAVEDVVVQGGHVRTAEVIAAVAGVAKGENIFSIDLERARSKLLHDPWIETATVSRHLPGRVTIHVVEREAGAIVAVPETYLAGRDGHIFKRLEAGDPGDLPVITGLTSEAIAQDRVGAERAIVRALDLANDYEHGPMAARSPLQEIHVSNGSELTLVVGKDGVAIALGLPPFRRKLDEAARIFSELEHRGAHASVVMLDDEARPDRVVVRTR